MKYSRCKWLPVVMAAVLAQPANAGPGQPNGVPLASDLKKAAAQAQAACVPLLLEFAADSCEYCVLLEEEVIKPMLRNRDYDRRTLVRKVTLDGAARLRDFDGRKVSASAIAQRYGITVTPTLIFVGQRGEELAERMVGVTTLEFYGGYLDQALDAAGQALREQTGCG